MSRNRQIVRNFCIVWVLYLIPNFSLKSVFGLTAGILIAGILSYPRWRHYLPIYWVFSYVALFVTVIFFFMWLVNLIF